VNLGMTGLKCRNDKLENARDDKLTVSTKA
jgi:hypothetical protein